jgi:predicted acylesterase/phospholipase RssA
MPPASSATARWRWSAPRRDRRVVRERACAFDEAEVHAPGSTDASAAARATAPPAAPPGSSALPLEAARRLPSTPMTARGDQPPAGGGAIAVVFEGCACRSAFAAGVGAELAQAGLPIAITAGASSGAIIAGAFAAGLDAELPALWEEVGGRSIVSWRRLLRNRSPFDMSTIVHDALRRAVGGGDLRARPIEALCTATRLRDLRTLVLSSREEPDFALAVLGSCFFPVLYGRTVRVRGELVIDGGATDNLPVAAVAARGARTILAVVPAADGTAMRRPFAPRVRPSELAPPGARVITIHPRRPLAIRSWDLDRGRMRAAIADGREAAARALERL